MASYSCLAPAAVLDTLDTIASSVCVLVYNRYNGATTCISSATYPYTALLAFPLTHPLLATR